MIATDLAMSLVAEMEVGSSNGALDAAWRTLEGPLRQLALWMTQDADAAEDLVQEALIELWLIDPSRFRMNDPNELAYLRRMLVNRMRDVKREGERDFALSADDASSGTEQGVTTI